MRYRASLDVPRMFHGRHVEPRLRNLPFDIRLRLRLHCALKEI